MEYFGNHPNAVRRRLEAKIGKLCKNVRRVVEPEGCISRYVVLPDVALYAELDKLKARLLKGDMATKKPKANPELVELINKLKRDCPGCETGMKVEYSVDHGVNVWSCDGCDNNYPLTMPEVEWHQRILEIQVGNVPVAPTPKALPNRGVKQAALGTGQIVKQAVMDAGTALVAAKAAESLVMLARHHLGEHWPAALDTPAGRKLAQVGVPIGILFLCQAFAESIPLAGQAEKMATLAIRGTAQEGIAEAMETVMPFIQSLAALGAGTPIQQLLSGTP